MNEADISNALGQRLAQAPSLGLVVWENQDVEPAKPYLIFEVVRTGVEDPTLAGGDAIHSGYVMISVVSDTGAFVTPALTIADTIAARFAYGLRLIIGTGHATITKPSEVKQGYTDGINWRTPVRVDYEAIGDSLFANNPPIVGGATISQDAGNVLGEGTDGGLYLPDTEQDFVTAAENLGGGRLVTVAGLHSQDATVNLILGVSAGAASNGARCTVRISGAMNDGAWAWTPGGAIFASPNGIMTQTAPTTGPMRRVAIAISATSIFIALQPTITLG